MVFLGLALWIIFSAAIPFLAHGNIPFDQPRLAALPYAVRVGAFVTGPLIALILIGIARLLTRNRKVEISTRAPERSIAMRETLGMLFYGAVVLIAGQLIGKAMGMHGIGLHLPGSMMGMTSSVSPAELYLWSGYNFVFYAALPYLFFRRKGYSNESLCLTSSNPRNDILVIAVILGIGLLSELPGNPIWHLGPRARAIGSLSAFIFSLLGTGLPIMIFLCSILVPRYKKLTGSVAATVLLGGFTYAALHLAEYWTLYDSPAHAALSVIFIFLLFGGPGMLKAYLTLRTGNAWVHLWAYHAIWPHVTSDIPVFAKIFGLA